MRKSFSHCVVFSFWLLFQLMFRSFEIRYNSVLVFWAIGIVFRKLSPMAISPEVFPIFSSCSIKVSRLGSLIHLDFCSGWEIRILHVDIQLSQHHFSPRCVFYIFLENQTAVTITGVFLDLLLLVGLCVCFYASTMLFLLQWLCA
jgi:hypothetical protein